MTSLYTSKTFQTLSSLLKELILKSITFSCLSFELLSLLIFMTVSSNRLVFIFPPTEGPLRVLLCILSLFQYPFITQVNFFLLRRLLGVRTKDSERQGRVSKLAKGEILMLNIGSMSTGARVVAIKNVFAKLQLTSPVCTSKGEKIALSRRIEKHWRLIGWGEIQAGITLDVPSSPL